jgi:hypothetical protein
MDIFLSMSSAATAPTVVSLDEYRRNRQADDKRPTAPRLQSVPATQPAPAVWVYWVPVWVW